MKPTVTVTSTHSEFPSRTTQLITYRITMEILTVFLALVTAIYIYFKWSFGYWKRKGVPSVKTATHIPFGSIENPLRRKTQIGLRLKMQYDTLKSQGHKHGGLYMFTQPVYLAIDPEIVKRILQTDFDHFAERGFYYNEKDDPLSGNLFILGGHKWKTLRGKLTSTFTAGKMRMMMETLIRCGYQMVEAVGEFSEKKEAVDIKDVVARYTTDIIGCCAFGLDCNSFKDPDAEFRKYGKLIFESSSPIAMLKLIFGFFKPELARKLGFKLIREECSDFFMKIVKEMVRYREENEERRRDMLQILIDLKNSTGDDSLTIEEVAAQAFVFFAAGFETSSTTMTFCLFELAMNPEIQQKARDEVDKVLIRHGGKITYEALKEMTYLNQVIDETLRKYPPLSFLTRQCVQDYTVPSSDDVKLNKGTMVAVSIYGLHHDSEFFPDPDKFDPDRFSEANKRKIKPFTYIPFGEGPRICLGLRFGLMETRVGLTLLLKNFKFSLDNRTVAPIEMDPFNLILTSKTDILLDVEKLKDE